MIARAEDKGRIISAMFWLLATLALLGAEGLKTVRACPQSTGACKCNAAESSVTCTRLVSLTRKLPVGIPTNTRKLKVSFTTLMRLGPAAFRNCYALEEVDLGSNRLEDISPRAFQNLDHLVALSLANNKLRFLTEDTFAYLGNLRFLDLSNNMMVVLTPHNFAMLHNLMHLVLLRNPVMCMDQGAFAGLTNLQKLEMSEMKTDLDEGLLRGLTNLKTLVLKSFHKVTSIPQFFLQNNSLLEDLTLGDFPKLGNPGIPETLFTGLESLRNLTLTSCGLHKVPKMALERVEMALRVLDLSHNPLSELRAGDLKYLRNLVKLKLSSTGLRTIHPGALDIERLVNLDISKNSLKGLQRNAFGGRLFRLKVLTLNQNPWTCDCQLRWIIQTRAVLATHQPVFCLEPPDMQGIDIRFAPQSVANSRFFSCTYPNISRFGILPQMTRDFYLGESPGSVTLSARCDVTGYPRPEVSWVLPTGQGGSKVKRSSEVICVKCKGNSIHPDMDISVDAHNTLHLIGLPPNLAIGVYTCRAENKLGVQLRSFTVTAAKATPSDKQRVKVLPQGGGNASLAGMNNYRDPIMNFRGVLAGKRRALDQSMMPIMSGALSKSGNKQLCEKLTDDPVCTQPRYSDITAANNGVSRPSVIEFPPKFGRGPEVRETGRNSEGYRNGSIKHFVYIRLGFLVLFVHNVFFGI